MKTYQFTTENLRDAIIEMCETLYDSDPAFKCEMRFWANGEITVSELMSKNTDVLWHESPVWTYYESGSYADEDITPKEETLSFWQDYIEGDIYENKPAEIEII